MAALRHWVTPRHDSDATPNSLLAVRGLSSTQLQWRRVADSPYIRGKNLADHCHDLNVDARILKRMFKNWMGGCELD
jgi:hypothetical protein